MDFIRKRSVISSKSFINDEEIKHSNRSQSAISDCYSNDDECESYPINNFFYKSIAASSILNTNQCNNENINKDKLNKSDSYINIYKTKNNQSNDRLYFVNEQENCAYNTSNNHNSGFHNYKLLNNNSYNVSLPIVDCNNIEKDEFRLCKNEDKDISEHDRVNHKEIMRVKSGNLPFTHMSKSSNDIVDQNKKFSRKCNCNHVVSTIKNVTYHNISYVELLNKETQSLPDFNKRDVSTETNEYNTNLSLCNLYLKNDKDNNCFEEIEQLFDHVLDIIYGLSGKSRFENDDPNNFQLTSEMLINDYFSAVPFNYIEHLRKVEPKIREIHHIILQIIQKQSSDLLKPAKRNVSMPYKSNHCRRYSESGVSNLNNGNVFCGGDIPHSSNTVIPNQLDGQNNDIVKQIAVGEETKNNKCQSDLLTRVFELNPFDDIVKSYRSQTDRRIKAIANRMKCKITVEGPVKVYDSTNTCWSARNRTAYHCLLFGDSKEAMSKCIRCLHDTFPQSYLFEKYYTPSVNATVNE